MEAVRRWACVLRLLPHHLFPRLTDLRESAFVVHPLTPNALDAKIPLLRKAGFWMLATARDTRVPPATMTTTSHAPTAAAWRDNKGGTEVRSRICAGLLLGFITALLCQLQPAAAEQIVVSNYGIAANGMPYAIAMKKGFFQQEGAEVSGILSSNGGGTTVRNLLEGNLPYGEIDLAGTVLAIQQGAPLKIISDNVLTVAEFVWAVRPDSPIKTLKDFKGQKIGYTNPRSTSQALDVLLLQTAGMTPQDAELVRVGGFGEQIVALNLGSINVATLADPVWSQNISQAAADRPRSRRAAAAVQRHRRGDRKGRRDPGRLPARGPARTPQGGRVHVLESRRRRGDRRRGLSSGPGGGAACDRAT